MCARVRTHVPGEGKDIWLGAEALPLFRDCPSERKYFIPLWNVNLPPSPCRGRLGLWLPGRLCGKRERCEWRGMGKWENPGEDGVLLPWVPFRLQHSESLLHFDLRSIHPQPLPCQHLKLNRSQTELILSPSPCSYPALFSTQLPKSSF